MKTTIYIFGNELLEEDSLPIQLAPDLQKKFPDINFVIADPNENLKPLNKKLVIIDTVINIEKVTVITDIDQITNPESLYTPHDLDLAFNIKLLQKIGELEKVTIFGLPPNIEKQTALDELVLLIASE